MPASLSLNASIIGEIETSGLTFDPILEFRLRSLPLRLVEGFCVLAKLDDHDEMKRVGRTWE